MSNEVAATRRLEALATAAYQERDACVALIAKMARAMGFAVWMGRHPKSDTSWDPEWMNIVYVMLPTGQLSWHIHDDELPMFSSIPRGLTEWDGHTTAEKYQRMREWRP